MPIVRIGVVVVILSAGFAGCAAAFEFKDIAGKWCGLDASSNLTYTFTQGTLTVEFKKGPPPQQFKITNFEYLSDSIRVFMLDGKGNTVSTRFFGVFTDGKMTQESPSGLRRPFHRC